MISRNDEKEKTPVERVVEYERQDREVEEAVEIPPDRINPDTLRNMIVEFVTREWSELTDSGYTLDEKVEQVLRQLRDGRARIVYDFTSESWNIVPVR